MKTYTQDEVRRSSLAFFSDNELRTDVYTGKYALRSGEVFYESKPPETSMRLAKEFAKAESKFPNPMTLPEIYGLLMKLDKSLIESDPGSETEEELVDAAVDYGEIMPQGSPTAAMGNWFQIQSLSNCFVIDAPYDSYGGICHTDEEQAQIMKRRGGVGFDLSTIRPKGQPTSNAARTTDGLGVFMERYSGTTEEVAQNGRRGALMLTISINHPEVETFINIKRDKKKVTGANISVRVTDEFMQAVKDDTDFTLRFPVEVPVEEAKITKVVRARDIWEQIIDAAWYSAEPGILFWDTAKRLSPADAYSDFGYGSTSTNPCITGDTLIAVADGRNAVSIQQLANDGVDVPVYSTNPSTGRVEIKMGRNPRLTKKSTEVWKLTLDDGSTLVATPDHRIMLKDCSYVKLKDLKPGDAIFPFYTHNSNGYRQISNTGVKMSGGVSWKNFANQVATNHKVSRVERLENCVDVYNITVDDNHNYHVITSYEDSRFVTSSGICVKNCGEIVLSPYDSCRLQVLDLRRFVVNPWSEDAYFDHVEFEHSVKKAQRLMDDLVELEIDAVDRILKKIDDDPEPEAVKRNEKELWLKIRKAAVNGRRTGLGITALGDALAMFGIKYGSDKSVEVVGEIYKTLAIASYKSSIDLAEERGHFPVWSWEHDITHPFLKQMYDALPPEYQQKWQKFGRRNIANTTTAPVGSGSIILDSTSGIECLFNVLPWKRRRKVEPGPGVKVDFVDEKGVSWQEYDVYHKGIQDWMDATDETDVTKSPYYGACAMDYDWVNGVRLQAAAQKWVCHSISRTANLPKDATHNLISKVYMTAWESGCKGFTAYRDGSRTGVLLTGDVAQNWLDGISDDELQKMIDIGEKFNYTMPSQYLEFLEEASREIERRNEGISVPPPQVYRAADKRPKKLPCDIHRARVMVNGESDSYLVLVGMHDEKPYEIFCGLTKHVDLPRKYEKGWIIKNGRKKPGNVATYNLCIGEGDDEIVFRDIVEQFDNPVYGAFSRTISLALRHHIPIQYVVEQLQKDKNSDIASWTRVVARILKTYIPDGTTTSLDKICPECGSESIVYQQGCPSCMSCGWTKCL